MTPWRSPGFWVACVLAAVVVLRCLVAHPVRVANDQNEESRLRYAQPLIAAHRGRQ